MDKQLMKGITRFLQEFSEIKNAGCANLDVVDLPEKCSMLQEPPFKIEETVARRWETLEFVCFQCPRLAGWGMKLHEYQLYTPYKDRRVHSVLSFRKAIMIKPLALRRDPNATHVKFP